LAARARTASLRGARSPAWPPGADPSVPRPLTPPPRPKSWKTRQGVLMQWHCPLCSYTTRVTPIWWSEKAQHLRRCHPDQQRRLRLYRSGVRTRPREQQHVPTWCCPVPGCNHILTEPAGAHASRMARLRHWRTSHSSEARSRFILGRRRSMPEARTSWLNATCARRLAAVRRFGLNGHRPKVVRWRWPIIFSLADGNYVSVFICASCGGMWRSLRELRARPCRPASRRIAAWRRRTAARVDEMIELYPDDAAELRAVRAMACDGEEGRAAVAEGAHARLDAAMQEGEDDATGALRRTRGVATGRTSPAPCR